MTAPQRPASNSDARKRAEAHTAENDAGLRFRVETACDGYSALWESDVPGDVLSVEDYLRGAHDAAEAIRGCVIPSGSDAS